MKPILRALRLFAHERGLWRYALVPFAWAALASLTAMTMAILFGERIGVVVARSIGLSLSVGEVGGIAIAALLVLAFAGPIYLGLVALVAGFGFERLSVAVEEAAFGRAEGHRVGLAAGLADGIPRALLTLTLSLLALCGSFLVVVPWLVAAYLALMDCTAPALLRRGVGLGRQFGVVRRLPDVLPFSALAGLIALVPVLNVLALPVLVAAGTLMVAEGHRNETM